MTWPTPDVVTTNLDASSDSPATARTDLLDLATKFNQMRNHLSALGQTLVNRSTAALMRADLGVAPRATRIDVASAATLNLTSSAPDSDDIRLTGAAAVTLVTIAVGRVVRVVASGSSSFANNANIVTQTGALLQLAAGDTLVLRATAGNVVEVMGYTQAVDLSAIGKVEFFARSTPPPGYLKANGAPISRTTYATLFAVIGTSFGVGDGSTTFALPDMRGEFLRGLDDGRGVDPSRVLGSAQLDQMQRITGSFDIGGGNTGSRKINGSASGAFGRQTSNSTGYLDTSVGYVSTDYTVGNTFDSGNSPSARVSATTSGETRPRNVALLACIKY